MQARRATRGARPAAGRGGPRPGPLRRSPRRRSSTRRARRDRSRGSARLLHIPVARGRKDVQDAAPAVNRLAAVRHVGRNVEAVADAEELHLVSLPAVERALEHEPHLDFWMMVDRRLGPVVDLNEGDPPVPAREDACSHAGGDLDQVAEVVVGEEVAHDGSSPRSLVDSEAAPATGTGACESSRASQYAFAASTLET